jgi:hypothetical protein
MRASRDDWCKEKVRMQHNVVAHEDNEYTYYATLTMSARLNHEACSMSRATQMPRYIETDASRMEAHARCWVTMDSDDNDN